MVILVTAWKVGEIMERAIWMVCGLRVMGQRKRMLIVVVNGLSSTDAAVVRPSTSTAKQQLIAG